MLPEEMINFLREQDPNYKNGLTKLVAWAQFLYLTHDEFSLDDTITFTLKNTYIEQSESLDFLGIKVTPKSSKELFSSDGGNPFGDLRMSTWEVWETSVNFPLELFRSDFILKKRKHSYLLIPGTRNSRKKK